MVFQTIPYSNKLATLAEVVTISTTHTNIDAIALRLEFYCNDALFRTEDLDGYTQNNDTYTFSFTLQQFLTGYFAKASETVCYLTAFIQTHEKLQAKVQIRAYELLPDADGYLQPSSSFIESDDFYVINSVLPEVAVNTLLSHQDSTYLINHWYISLFTRLVL